MATSVPQTLYPFSTRDAEAIPLDIIDPLAVLVLNIAGGAGAFSIGAIPTGYDLGHVYSAKGCYIKFGVNTVFTVPPGGMQNNILFVPPGMIITVKMQVGNISAISLTGDAASCTIQAIRKWNTLAVNQQARIG